MTSCKERNASPGRGAEASLKHLASCAYVTFKPPTALSMSSILRILNKSFSLALSFHHPVRKLLDTKGQNHELGQALFSCVNDCFYRHVAISGCIIQRDSLLSLNDELKILLQEKRVICSRKGVKNTSLGVLEAV